MAGNAGAPGLQSAGGTLENFDGPALLQQHVADKQSAHRTAGNHCFALAGDRHDLSTQPNKSLATNSRISRVKLTFRPRPEPALFPPVFSLTVGARAITRQVFSKLLLSG